MGWDIGANQTADRNGLWMLIDGKTQYIPYLETKTSTHFVVKLGTSGEFQFKSDQRLYTNNKIYFGDSGSSSCIYIDSSGYMNFLSNAKMNFYPSAFNTLESFDSKLTNLMATNVAITNQTIAAWSITGGAWDIGASMFTYPVPAAWNISGKLIDTNTIGAANGAWLLDGAGGLNVQGYLKVKLQTKVFANSPYTIAATDMVVLLDCTDGSITVNLPAAATSNGRKLILKKIDSSIINTVTIDGNSSENIDGAGTYPLNAQYDKVEIVCDGSNWFVV
jgi:hypothetical protein